MGKGGLSSRLVCVLGVLHALHLERPMKLLALILCLLACDSRAERGVFNDLLVVEWDYSPDDIEGTTFRIYGSADITEPMELWPVVCTVTGQTWAQFEVDQTAMFFAVTAQNWRGEGNFSNVIRVQGPPLSDFRLRIKTTNTTPTR